MTPGQDQYWLVPGWALLLAIFAIASALFAWRASQLWSYLRLGASADRSEQSRLRGRRFLVNVIGQRRLFRDARAGVMHAVIFWGFLILTLGTIEIMAEGLFAGFEIPALGTDSWFRLLIDTSQGLVMIAVGYAFSRRLFSRPPRLFFSREALVILGLIFALMLTSFGSGAFRLVANPSRSDRWLPLTGTLAHLIRFLGLTSGGAAVPYAVCWWLHIGLLFGFLVLIPYSKHLHIVTAPLNVYFSDINPAGRLTPINFETDDEFGVSRIQDLSWKDLLDVYTCTECGRCDAVCPATATGKELRPRSLILNLQHHLIDDAGPRLVANQAEPVAPDKLEPFLGRVISEQALWECTTCRACVQECPVFIEHVPKIVDMRRALVMMESRFPEELSGPFRGLETTGNPWQYPAEGRGTWAETAGVRILSDAIPADTDYLFWVGCYGSYDTRNKKVTVAVAEVLRRAGVSFGVLGPREKCTGDPARRAGNEYLFQMLASDNVATMNSAGIRKIVTACPHCFNTLKNEYPDFGGQYEVVHHTELIAELVADGRLGLDRPLDQSVTYHDPCYLGRYNGVYDPPRYLLEQMQGIKLIEMARSRDRSFCCGAGGARGFMEEDPSKRVNEHRIAQAEETGAATLAVSCPFCMNMFQDGIQSRGGVGLQGEDVAELVERASRPLRDEAAPTR